MQRSIFKYRTGTTKAFISINKVKINLYIGKIKVLSNLNRVESFDSPHIISLAVGLAVSNKAGTVLVEELMALCALEARGVPLQVGRHPQNVLVVDLGTATNTQAQSPFFCNTHQKNIKKAARQSAYARQAARINNSARLIKEPRRRPKGIFSTRTAFYIYGAALRPRDIKRACCVKSQCLQNIED